MLRQFGCKLQAVRDAAILPLPAFAGQMGRPVAVLTDARNPQVEVAVPCIDLANLSVQEVQGVFSRELLQETAGITISIRVARPFRLEEGQHSLNCFQGLDTRTAS